MVTVEVLTSLGFMVTVGVLTSLGLISLFLLFMTRIIDVAVAAIKISTEIIVRTFAFMATF